MDLKTASIDNLDAASLASLTSEDQDGCPETTSYTGRHFLPTAPSDRFGMVLKIPCCRELRWNYLYDDNHFELHLFFHVAIISQEPKMRYQWLNGFGVLNITWIEFVRVENVLSEMPDL